ncbi:MAG: zinc ribbon domain-containing protein [Deinococcales bacterium]
MGTERVKKPLGVRTWTCSKCKATHDRDINAAINILARFVPLSADMSQEGVGSLRAHPLSGVVHRLYITKICWWDGFETHPCLKVMFA